MPKYPPAGSQLYREPVAHYPLRLGRLAKKAKSIGSSAR